MDEIQEVNERMRKQIKHEPFERTRLDEDKADDKGKVIPIRLNEEELANLDLDMRMIDTNQAAAAIKILWERGRNVIRRDLGDENLKWLTSKTRKRYADKK